MTEAEKLNNLTRSGAAEMLARHGLQLAEQQPQGFIIDSARVEKTKQILDNTYNEIAAKDKKAPNVEGRRQNAKNAATQLLGDPVYGELENKSVAAGAELAKFGSELAAKYRSQRELRNPNDPSAFPVKLGNRFYASVDGDDMKLMKLENQHFGAEMKQSDRIEDACKKNSVPKDDRVYVKSALHQSHPAHAMQQLRSDGRELATGTKPAPSISSGVELSGQSAIRKA